MWCLKSHSFLFIAVIVVLIKVETDKQYLILQHQFNVVALEELGGAQLQLLSCAF